MAADMFVLSRQEATSDGGRIVLLFFVRRIGATSE
jgi:hypothetical protein